MMGLIMVRVISVMVIIKMGFKRDLVSPKWLWLGWGIRKRVGIEVL